MQNVSDRFLEALTRSHKMVSGVDLIINGEVADRLPINGGSVDVEAAADVRRRCSFTVPDAFKKWAPKGRTTDPLNPFGTTVAVWRGIQYPDVVDPEIVGLGTFSITSINDDETGGLLSVGGRDFSHNANRGLRSPVPIPGATRHDVAAAKVLSAAWPNASYRFADDVETSTRPMLVVAGSNGLAAAKKIVGVGGFNLYPDIDGAFIMPPLPGSLGGTVPVATIRGGVGGTLIGSTRSWSSEDHPFNGVVVQGAAVRGRSVHYEIWDDRPDSLTYRGGLYGENPDVIVDDQITNMGQAERLGRARLQRHLGKGVEVPGTMLVNPALDADDLVILQSKNDPPQAYFIHTLTIPLGAKDVMPFTLRRGIFGDEEATEETAA